MSNTGKYIVYSILWTFVGLALSPYVFHHEFTAKEAVVCKCICYKCQSSTNEFYNVGDRPSKLSQLLDKKPATNEWEQGEFVTLRRVYPHQRCGGYFVFNGKATPAPYSEKEFFYTHVCDLCGATNQIFNATWPQFKQEWRPL